MGMALAARMFFVLVTTGINFLVPQTIQLICCRRLEAEFLVATTLTQPDVNSTPSAGQLVGKQDAVSNNVTQLGLLRLGSCLD